RGLARGPVGRPRMPASASGLLCDIILAGIPVDGRAQERQGRLRKRQEHMGKDWSDADETWAHNVAAMR
ncbi:MAG TPA: hypothetical protein VFN78_08995, partial [Ktedonobacterales bacterium]|nr:hypothetical protein [Ktedonobacterales bacterium]